MTSNGNFSPIRLGDHSLKIGSGATPRGGSKVYQEDGIALIRSQNVYNNEFDYSDLAYIDKARARKLDNVVVELGDILLNITGASVARVCQVPKDILPARVNQHVTIIRPNPEILAPQYVKYYLLSPKMQAHMTMLASAGATRQALTKGMIEDFQILAPPLSEQRAIAAILGSLDDKIELNRRMNATLEAIARALFKSWFVDFDPVYANRGERASSLPAEVLDLFPDTLVASELGMIPAGWKVKPVGSIVKAVGGGTPSTKNEAYWDNGIHSFATPKDMSSLSAPIILETERKVTDAGLAKISSGLLPIGTVLLSSRAPVGYLAITQIPLCINQGFIAMICDGPVSNYYMLNWTWANMDIIKGRASGTTFPEISKRNFRPILALLPPKKVIIAFNKIVAPIYAKITLALEESRTLAELRDTLLPRLISGQLRVPEGRIGQDSQDFQD